MKILQKPRFDRMSLIHGVRALRDCCIMPYPRPIGNDSQLPLMSTCADGMHCTDDAEGPRLINCYFGGLRAPPAPFFLEALSSG